MTATMSPAMPPRLTRGHLARLQQSRVYDFLTRLPMLGWASLLAMASIEDIVR